MDELLKELDKYYNISSDPRYRGEHPKCDEIIDRLAEEFSKMEESDLRELLDGMDHEHLEQVSGALMDLDYDWVNEYWQF